MHRKAIFAISPRPRNNPNNSLAISYFNFNCSPGDHLGPTLRNYLNPTKQPEPTMILKSVSPRVLTRQIVHSPPFTQTQKTKNSCSPPHEVNHAKFYLHNCSPGHPGLACLHWPRAAHAAPPGYHQAEKSLRLSGSSAAVGQQLGSGSASGGNLQCIRRQPCKLADEEARHLDGCCGSAAKWRGSGNLAINPSGS